MKRSKGTSIVLCCVAAALMVAAAFAPWAGESDGRYSQSVHLLGIDGCRGNEVGDCQRFSWGEAIGGVAEHPRTSLYVMAWAAKFTFGLSLALAAACVAAAALYSRGSRRGGTWVLIFATMTASSAIAFLVAADKQLLGSWSIGLILFWVGFATAIVGALVPRLTSGGSARRMCPFCAESIRIEAVVCKHCHKDVKPPDEVHEAVRTSDDPPWVSTPRTIATPQRKPAALIVDEDAESIGATERRDVDSGVSERSRSDASRRHDHSRARRFVLIALAATVPLAGGLLAYRVWRSHREAASKQFTLPGWEDLRLGIAPPEDMTCTLASCQGRRKANREVSEVNAARRRSDADESAKSEAHFEPDRDLVVADVEASLDAPGVAALTRRWGKPDRVVQVKPDEVASVWCSSDQREVAVLSAVVGGTVVIVRTDGDFADRARDFLSADREHNPYRGPVCGKPGDDGPSTHTQPSGCPSASATSAMLKAALKTNLEPTEIKCASGRFPEPGWVFVAWLGNRVDNPMAHERKDGTTDDSHIAHLHHIVLDKEGRLLGDIEEAASWHERNDDGGTTTQRLMTIDLDGDGTDEIIEETEFSRYEESDVVHVFTVKRSALTDVADLVFAETSKMGWGCASTWSIDTKTDGTREIVVPEPRRYVWEPDPDVHPGECFHASRFSLHDHVADASVKPEANTVEMFANVMENGMMLAFDHQRAKFVWIPNTPDPNADRTPQPATSTPAVDACVRVLVAAVRRCQACAIDNGHGKAPSDRDCWSPAAGATRAERCTYADGVPGSAVDACVKQVTAAPCSVYEQPTWQLPAGCDGSGLAETARWPGPKSLGYLSAAQQLLSTGSGYAAYASTDQGTTINVLVYCSAGQCSIAGFTHEHGQLAQAFAGRIEGRTLRVGGPLKLTSGHGEHSEVWTFSDGATTATISETTDISADPTPPSHFATTHTAGALIDCDTDKACAALRASLARTVTQ